MLVNLIFVLFLFCTAIHLVFYSFIYSALGFKKKDSNSLNSSYPPVSVIICARNEEAFLQKNLIHVLEQDYPEFEVIVVNDCSSDNTRPLLNELEKKYSRLRSLTIQEDKVYKHGKKLPITVGIKNAQYEYLVFTDADCYPASAGWLKSLMSSFDEETEIVLGYGAYEKKKGLVNQLIRMDTLQIGLQYLSLATAGMPYMGVGRNLAYKKSLFLKQKGFAPFSHILSGDDDLFVNKSATRFNTRIASGPESITISEPKETINEWVRQKRRHVSTARHYKASTLFALGILTSSQYLFWFTFVALLFTHWWQISLVVFGLRLLMQLFVFNKAMKRLGESDLLLYSLVIEWLLLFGFYPGVAISNMLFKQVKWKT